MRLFKYENNLHRQLITQIIHTQNNYILCVVIIKRLRYKHVLLNVQNTILPDTSYGYNLANKGGTQHLFGGNITIQ